MSENKPIMEGRESRIYGDFIREINVSAEKPPKLKLESPKQKRSKAPVPRLLGFIDASQREPACPEEPPDCLEPLFGPADALPCLRLFG